MVGKIFARIEYARDDRIQPLSDVALTLYDMTPCLENVQIMSGSCTIASRACQNLVRIMAEPRPNRVRIVSTRIQACPNRVQIMSKSCQNHVQIVPGPCPNPIQTLPESVGIMPSRAHIVSESCEIMMPTRCGQDTHSDTIRHDMDTILTLILTRFDIIVTRC